MSTSLTLSESLVSDLLPADSFSVEAIQKICSRLPELHRGKRIVGRRNSQTTSALQSLAMIADSPYRQMKQCLAQIDGKRKALIHAHFTLKKNNVKIKTWRDKNTELSNVLADEASVENVEMQESCENSMKEIGMFQDMYDQIRESHGIPVDWDEADFESQEIDNALRMGFRQAIQNISSTGKIAVSTSEYWEQFGVHPQVGEKLVRDYMRSVDAEIKDGKLPSVTSMHDFLEKMVVTFQDEHKKSLTRIGVDALVNHQYAYKKNGANNNDNH